MSFEQLELVFLEPRYKERGLIFVKEGLHLVAHQIWEHHWGDTFNVDWYINKTRIAFVYEKSHDSNTHQSFAHSTFVRKALVAEIRHFGRTLIKEINGKV